MAKYLNRRFYFENLGHDLGNFELYLAEIHEVANSGVTDALLVRDFVGHQVMGNEDLCDLCLTVSRETEIEKTHMIHKIWWLLLNEILSISDELLIGVWKSQIEILREVLSKPEVKKVDDMDEQIFITIQISPEIIDWLEANSFGESLSLNWFDLVLFRQVEGTSIPLFSSTHYGKDICLYGLKNTDVEKVLASLDGNRLQIDLNHTQKEAAI